MPAKVHALALRLAGHVDGEERDHEGGKVGEEMGGVRGDGQRVGHHPAHNFTFSVERD